MNKQLFRSEEFDVKHGSSLSKRWELPSIWDEHTIGMRMPKANTEWSNEEKQFVVKMFNSIVELNPELGHIKVNDYQDAWNVIYGVISRFNYDDIKFFLEGWNSKSETGKQHWNEIRKVSSISGEDINWIPSPRTLEKIQKTLRV